MEKLSKKQLQNAYQELIDVLGLVDDETKQPVVIPHGVTEEQLIDYINVAKGWIEPDQDTFTEETNFVLSNLNGTTDAPEEPVLKKGTLSEPPEGVEVQVLPLDDTSLASEIATCGKLKDLRDIATTYDQFKKIRGVLSSYRTIEGLRTDMLEIIKDAAMQAKPKTTKPRRKRGEGKFTRVTALVEVLLSMPDDTPAKVICAEADRIYTAKTKQPPNIRQMTRRFRTVNKVYKMIKTAMHATK